jgi:hypothetical protein
LLPAAAPGVQAPVSIRAAHGSLRLLPVPERHLPSAVVDACRQALELPGSVGLIVSDRAVVPTGRALSKAGLPHVVLGAEEDSRLTVVPAAVAKGLEFDHVVLVEPADIAAGDDVDPRFGLRRLYIALTRAVSGLVVVHAKPLPEALAA